MLRPGNVSSKILSSMELNDESQLYNLSMLAYSGTCYGLEICPLKSHYQDEILQQSAGSEP